MNTFTLKYATFSDQSMYRVAISTFEDGVEQRRLISPTPKMTFVITSPALTKAKAKSWRDFFDGQRGATDAFYFTHPDTGTQHTVRFSAEAGFKCEFTGGIRTIVVEMEVVS